MNAKPKKPVHVDTLVEKIRAVTYCLARSRFSIIILVIGLALLLSDQGRDLLSYYGENGATQYVALMAAFWALSVWGWCRLLLDINYGNPPKSQNWYKKTRTWMPRILGALAFVVLLFSARAANQSALTWSALVGLLAFGTFVIGRRPAQRRAASVLAKSAQIVPQKLSTARAIPQKLSNAMIVSDIADKPPYQSFLEAIGMPKGFMRWRDWSFRAYLVLSLYTLFVLLLGTALATPVWLGQFLGAMVLFFLWAATWLPIGSLMSYVADKHGWPLLTALAVLALVSSCFNDNHEIRLAKNGKSPEQRLTVTGALNLWSQANPPTAGKPTPFVLVATAGGGIRAAYWTATVLGRLHEDSRGQFAQRTFAISGVSGGSVGATVYRAWLDVSTDKTTECGGVSSCVKQVLAKDLLGPLAAAMLYQDLGQRFVPWPILPDRGEAFEKGLEESFATVAKADLLSESLGELSSKPWAPALFLNSTWVDTGRRIVASNLRFASADRAGGGTKELNLFQLPVDELAQLGRDLRLSTAAHNSARFPYVNPPGMWKEQKIEREPNGEEKRKEVIAGRLEDGGLFENYGAETAQEILELACSTFSCAQQIKDCQQSKRCIRPIVVLISSDPSLPENLADVPNKSAMRWGYEVRSTFRAYERVRGGRGAEAAVRLKERTHDNGGEFLSFRMCPANSNGAEPPLGWALSAEARRTIEAYLPSAASGASPLTCPDQNVSSSSMLQEALK